MMRRGRARVFRSPSSTTSSMLFCLGNATCVSLLDLLVNDAPLAPERRFWSVSPNVTGGLLGITRATE